MKYQKRCWVNHESWWTQQLPTQEEMDPGRRNLEKHGNCVDFVISHCLPQTLVYIFFQFPNKADMMTVYFNDLMKNGLQIGACTVVTTIWISG